MTCWEDPPEQQRYTAWYPGVGHQGFFHTGGQQPTIGQGADTICYLRSSGCELILLISEMEVCPPLSVALPLFFSVQ